MTARRTQTALSLLAAAALLAACATKVPLNEAPVESRTPVPVSPGSTPPAAPSATGPAPAATSTVTTVDTAASTLAAANRAGRVVYFDFDSFVLKDEFKPLVDAHAKALVANGARRIAVEGHADERGGREYNLALGQKRAEVVARALKLLGAKDAQIEATSYGEERPADPGHDEQAWAKNRRAELKDR
jgi:peptidoglycan-associated lipoprotein